jgi:hypothetical protein
MMVDKLIQPGKSWDFLVVGSSKSKLQPFFYVFFVFRHIENGGWFYRGYGLLMSLLWSYKVVPPSNKLVYNPH